MSLGLLLAILFMLIGFIFAGCFLNTRQSDLKNDQEMLAISVFTGAMTLLYFLSAVIILYKIFS
jgi:hypothetical protein